MQITNAKKLLKARDIVQFSVQKKEYNSQNKNLKIEILAKIQPGWILYSSAMVSATSGPLPTKFVFDSTVKLIQTNESKPIQAKDKASDAIVKYFSKEAHFTVTGKVLSASKVHPLTIKFMSCNDTQCLPPDKISFDIKI